MTSPVGSRYSKSDRPAAAGREQHSRRSGGAKGPASGERRQDTARDRELIYGRNAVREALRGKRRVHSITLAAGEGPDVEPTLQETVREWAREAGAGNPRISHSAYRELTTQVRAPEHQGIVAEVDPYPYCEAQELLNGYTLLVALDEVQDPHNLGAIIRTAQAAGAGVVTMRHRAAEITGAVVKASAGATEHSSVSRVRNLSDFLSQAKKSGFWIYGAAAGAESDYTAQDYSYPTCLVLGSEGRGLGRRVSSMCDVMISLPLLGSVESLNVSVSAGILLYEALRQRRGQEE